VAVGDIFIRKTANSDRLLACGNIAIFTIMNEYRRRFDAGQ